MSAPRAEAASIVRYVRAPDVLWRRLIDEVIVLPPSRDVPLRLQGTGVPLWDLLEHERSLDELAEILAAHHRAAAEVVHADLTPVLEELVETGAVQAASEWS